MDGLVLSNGYVNSTDVVGVDCITELCACDANPVINWGPGWTEVGGSYPSDVPPEGGFVLRPVQYALPKDFGNNGRYVKLPPRVKDNFGEPVVIGNNLFMEIRYCLPPSMLIYFDFDELLDGNVRLFLLPEYDDDSIRCVICTEATNYRSERLKNFVNAACANSINLSWPTSKSMIDVIGEGIDEPSLFPHQRRTVAWMKNIEKQGFTTMKIYPTEFNGEELGRKFALPLVCGGIVGHPPGSGKTRIVKFLKGTSFVLCPSHLVEHWLKEVPDAIIVGFDQCTDEEVLRDIQNRLEESDRLVVDEPQDIPLDARAKVQKVCESTDRPRWVLCGTAYEAHWNFCAQIVLGRAMFHAFTTRNEWLGLPCVGHFLRERVIRDPRSQCLPYPPVQIKSIPVALKLHETLDAQIVSLAGFLMDSILFLTFGSEIAAKAVEERAALLRRMGWTVPLQLQIVHGENWGNVEEVTKSRLEKAKQELLVLEARAETQQNKFLNVDVGLTDRVRVTLIDGHETKIITDASTAEWNRVCTITGSINLRGGVKLIPFDRALASGFPSKNWARATLDAASHDGATAVVFLLDDEDPENEEHDLVVMNQAADEARPSIPAVMVKGKEEDFEQWESLKIEILPVEEDDQAAWEILEDFTDEKLMSRLQERKQEIESLNQALIFAVEAGEKALVGFKDDVCPVCLDAFGASVAVLPDCFHSVCPNCVRYLKKCPVCRQEVNTTPMIVRVASGDDEESPRIKPSQTSKERALIELLNSILADPNERVVVYTQWLVHVDHLHALLAQMKIPALAMCGTFAQRVDALREFGQPDAPRVLILSTQLHATGANLQIARHCVIMHPYADPTSVHFDERTFTQMKAYEKQCLGRVQRFPQKKEVVLYRLYAENSVEQILCEELSPQRATHISDTTKPEGTVDHAPDANMHSDSPLGTASHTTQALLDRAISSSDEPEGADEGSPILRQEGSACMY